MPPSLLLKQKDSNLFGVITQTSFIHFLVDLQPHQNSRSGSTCPSHCHPDLLNSLTFQIPYHAFPIQISIASYLFLLVVRGFIYPDLPLPKGRLIQFDIVFVGFQVIWDSLETLQNESQLLLANSSGGQVKFILELESSKCTTLVANCMT
ncbi:MAG: hypothetical protein EZS28_052174 [Streblomastix strix]|uniref:Uncharacterized protein n=1 Tax=Streblomastix strix TaxID=222440 RepID=A0A5J4SGH2_9EUKA|nr:MAG: hypothetical protein EZS28_052174 [Streblomastix strix]